MSLSSLDVKKKFASRSYRVKSVDLHPTEPWILASLYNGALYIYNYLTQTTVKQFEVSDNPLRCAKFVPRKQWIVVGSDDFQIRVYNYNTMELIKRWEAHADFIRCVAVHPTLPYIITSSDDITIKMWNWEKDFSLVRTFEGHTHYIMQLVFNPKDSNTFASASLDRTIKIWNINSTVPNLTLEGHEGPVNCVDYYHGGDNPYIASGADDNTIRIWDLQSKTCIKVLQGHSNNVTTISFHPDIPIIISGSEDGSIKIWNNTTYRLEKTLNYGWDRVWSVSCMKGSNNLAAGFDDGTIMLKVGKEVPSASMDQTGKIIFSKYNVISGYNCSAALKEGVEDGAILNLIPKELSTSEFSPSTVRHNHNGRFVAAFNDREYVIYTALQVRSKMFGNAVDFVWDKSGGFAIQESSGIIKIYNKNFEESKVIKLDFYPDGLFGGHLLGVRGNGFICFYDWKKGTFIRKIDVSAKLVCWSENDEQVAIVSDTSYFVLNYASENVKSIIASGASIPEDGIDDAFELVHEISEKVRTATWVKDCFIFCNAQNVIKYNIGPRTDIVGHLDHSMFLLGYLPKYGRILLIDKKNNIVSYALKLSIINYQSAISKGDMKAADAILNEISMSDRTRVAQFLESQGYKEKALEVTTDVDHQFELAIQLQKMDLAYKLALKSEHEQKWRMLSDLAIQNLDFKMAEECLWRSEDYSGLLLFYTSSRDQKGVHKLAKKAREVGKYNIAFACNLLLKNVEECIDIMIKTGRIAEAAFMARTYAPSKVSEIVGLWKNDLGKVNPILAESLADPIEFPNLFPDIQPYLNGEVNKPYVSLDEDDRTDEIEIQRKEEERLKQEEQERLEQEENERLKQEEKERLKQEEQERLKQEEQERLEQEENERLKQEEQERLEQEENERLEQEHQERLQQAEQERLDQEENERLHQDEQERIEQEEQKGLELNEKERIKQEEEERSEHEESEEDQFEPEDSQFESEEALYAIQDSETFDEASLLDDEVFGKDEDFLA